MQASNEAPSFHDVLNLLMRAELVSGSRVVTDGVRIERLRSRNIGYLVEVASGDAFFVKYLHPRAGRLGVGKEAAVNRDIEKSQVSVLRRSVPPLLWHSEDKAVLVYRAVVGDPTMSDHIRSARPSQRVARHLATVLAELHGSPAPTYKARTPHGLLVHNPTLAELPSMSAAHLQLLHLIQGNDELVDHLDQAVSSWRPDAFVHADLKFDNILIRRGTDGRSHSVRIVDWEDAGSGDARWDVGAVFGAYLAAWLTSIPHIRADSPSPLAPLARVNREALLPSVRTFWECYAAQRHLVSNESAEFLRSAIRYAGVRLIQAASEGTTAGPLTAVHMFLLQVGTNMLSRPRDATTRLLGLQTEWGAPP